MRDEQIGQPHSLAQVEHQVQHLRLHIHIQRRDRFIRHDQRRLQRQRAGDRDALPLPAGKLMREAFTPGLVQPNHVEQPTNALAGLRRILHAAMHEQRLGKNIADPHARVQ